MSERLTAAGHDLTVLDLYAEGFAPVLDADAWRAHRRNEQIEALDLGAHVAALETAQGLVIVYPTWWYGLPAMLKGWFDRVWRPEVAFRLKDGVFKLHTLAGLKRLAVATTYGSPRLFIEWIVGDPARRQIMRGLALQFARNLRTCWTPIYAVDQRSQADLAEARRRLVDRVVRHFA